MTAEGRDIEWRIRRYEFPLLIGLVVMWMALWREISVLSALSGLLVALVAMRVFYLPPVELAERLNLWWGIRYLAYFFWHVAVASVQVSWLAVRPKPTPHCSIIGIELRTQSDFILTLVGLTISLIPGSFIVDVDRETMTLYLHVLNTPDERSINRMRREVSKIEVLLVRTLGSKEEVRTIAA